MIRASLFVTAIMLACLVMVCAAGFCLYVVVADLRSRTSTKLQTYSEINITGAPYPWALVICFIEALIMLLVAGAVVNGFWLLPEEGVDVEDAIALARHAGAVLTLWLMGALSLLGLGLAMLRVYRAWANKEPTAFATIKLQGVLCAIAGTCSLWSFTKVADLLSQLFFG